MTPFDPLPSVSIVALLEPLCRPGESKLRAAERVLIAEYMERAGGVQIVAADLLGIPQWTLSRKLARYTARPKDQEAA